MKRAYLVLRCGILWAISGVHFFFGTLLLLLLAVFVDPRKNDRPQRIFARNILRLAGVKFRVRYAPGFDPARTSIFVCNHVNIFDPFVVYSAIPQFLRGWELESHFSLPIYGWMMKRFGNVPVPDNKTPGSLKKLFRRTREALDNGTSLAVFAEGSRTLDGRVQPFRPGIFRMVRDLGYPIVPVSIVGSFAFYRKGSRMLYPSTITVHIHDTIDTRSLPPEKLEQLQDRVYQIISAPIHEDLGRAVPGDVSAETSATRGRRSILG
ncbi:MAG: 1-acyl-sn-glycerol-3-phosphate acyltransferase [Acidobacteria bacterium]|nr:1-acyl-sn-glycerol-3-phosphate acyltransferase [Acidobacteriota bacterium]